MQTASQEQVPVGGGRARGTVPRAARRSIRELALTWGAVFGTLVLATAAGLGISAAMVRRATDAVTRETQALTVASDLELDVAAYRRFADLTAQLPGSVAGASREALAHGLRAQVQQIRSRGGNRRQRELIEEVAGHLDTYLSTVDGVVGTPDQRAIDITSGHYVRLLGSLRALHAADVAAARSAHVDVVRLTRLAYLGGAVAACLLLVALAVIGRRVHTLLVHPLLELHAAITRFRSGDAAARAPVTGPREIAELTAAFDEMADAIAVQRDAQLAFLGGVAHDLRNPLSAMALGVRSLERGLEGPARERTLALLQRQVTRLSRMVEDFLDATRIEAGHLELQRREMDVCEAARDAAELYAPGATRHQLVLELPGRPVLVEADPMRIEQVLGNLVSNAIKYSPEGGVVLVRVRRSADQVVLEVIDRGIGMTKEELAELFAPFRRRAPQVAGGAGLGLSVVRRIVVAHGGTIEVESAPKLGTTFRVTLPVARPADAAADVEAAPAPGLGSPSSA